MRRSNTMKQRLLLSALAVLTVRCGPELASDELGNGTDELHSRYAPKVVITSPSDGATVPEGAVKVSGTATDNRGVERVELKVDDGAYAPAQLDCSRTPCQWSISATLNGPGTHKLTARATDAAGQNGWNSIDVSVLEAGTPDAGSGETPPVAGGLIPQRPVDFHARWWDLSGFEPRATDVGYMEFHPSGDLSTDIANIKRTLGPIPPKQRELRSVSIKGAEAVLPALYAQGFEIGILGYDHEGWEYTPQEEKDDPIGSCQRGQALARKFGVKFLLSTVNWMAKRWGAQAAPYVDIFKPQNKGQQDADYRVAIQEQRELYRALKAANPNIVLFHDMAACPKGNCKPLRELLDYYYGLSDMVEGIGIWATGSHEATLKPFVLTVHPPATPPAGDRSPLVANVSASSTTVRVGQTVSFSASANDPDGDPLTFTWDFGDHARWGDGNRLTLGSPGASHAYASAGTYTVRLQVTDGRGGSVTRDLTLTVQP